MERQNYILARALVQVYASGIVFLGWAQSRAIFLWFTPFTLLACSGLLLYNEQKKSRSLCLYVALVYAGGFALEALGVATGKVFGAYHYTQVLGWGVLNVPLVIGLNWAVLIYAACLFVDLHLRTQHIFIKSALVGLLLVSLDWLIEPVAIALNFWQWHSTQVPLQNYVVWFCYSALAAAAFFGLKICAKNKLAGLFLAVNFVFFGALRVFFTL